MLRFRQVDQDNANAKVHEKAAQRLYDKCDIIVSDKFLLETDIGTKKIIMMTAKAWHGNVCMKNVVWDPEILQMTILDLNRNDKNMA